MLKRKENRKERKRFYKYQKNIEKTIDKNKDLCYNIDNIKRAKSSERKDCFYYVKGVHVLFEQ